MFFFRQKTACEMRISDWSSDVCSSDLTINPDLANGRGADVDLFGSSVDLHFDGWTLSNRASYLSGDASTNGLFTGANPQTLSSFIEDQISSVNGNADIVAAAGGLARSGERRDGKEGGGKCRARGG